MSEEVSIRDARVDDHDDIRSITADTWPDRDGGDYLGRVFPQWIEPGDQPKRTLVAEVVGHAVAIAQSVILSDHEAWGQGLRVHPDHRGLHLSRRLTAALFDWASDQGASVMRAMVFSWNVAGLGQARSSGYRPTCAFRWVHPDPAQTGIASQYLDDPERPYLPASVAVSVSDDPKAAWNAFQGSAVARALRGLTLSLDESWAVSELTPATLARAAEETAVIAINTPGGADGMSYRTRTFEREDEDGDPYTVAEYGVAVWEEVPVAAALLDAIAADAASIGADRTRVLVPETPSHVSDAALLRAEIAEHPDFVVSADLTATERLSRH